MTRRHFALAGVIVAGSGMVLASLTAPATAAPVQAPSSDSALVNAMKRDLKLTSAQAHRRLADEAKSRRAAAQLKGSLGNAYAGAWVTSGKLTVATTNASLSGEIRQSGATPMVAPRSYSELKAIKKRLDRRRNAPSSVTSWGVDVQSNKVVVRATSRKAARTFAGSSSSIKIEVSDEQPRTYADLRGGDAYYISGTARCSIGFSVEGGFVSAGHCGNAGDQTTGHDQSDQGTFKASVFPGEGDFSHIEVNQNWTAKGIVKGESGDINVAGSEEAEIGAAICRSGSTTGWKCGELEAKDQTVRYPQGTVTGLTQTSACAEPGDSGGSFVTGDPAQAQGMTSGGSGNCTSGGTTFYQPVNEVLEKYSLKLVTAS